MDKLKYIKIEDENGNLSEQIPIGADAINIDTSSGSNVQSELSLLKNKDINIDNDIKNIQNQIKSLANGSPLVADNISNMIDKTKIYVNISDGHWYYWNGAIWTDGGIYQATEGYEETFELINKKFDDYLGIPLDPGEIIIGKYINAATGELTSFTSETTFKATDYITINGLKQIYLKATFHYGKDGLAFYDINKNFISGYKEKGTDYVILEVPKGAYYLRSSSFQSEEFIIYPIQKLKSIDNNIIEINQSLTNINKQLKDTITNIETISLEDIKNGYTIDLLNSIENFKSTASTEILEIKDNELYWKIDAEASTNKWLFLEQNSLIIPLSWSNNLDISFTARGENLSNNKLTLYVSDGRSSYHDEHAVRLVVYNLSDTKQTFTYSIDPSYYTVYKDPAWEKFNFWLVYTAIRQEEGNNDTIIISDFKVSQKIDKFDYEFIAGDNTQELFKSVDDNIKQLKENPNIENSNNNSILVGPNGNKYELIINTNGEVVAAPFIPNKAFFFGNSLLVGSGYGMAASDEEHDYYYLINNYIKSLNSNYTAQKKQGGVLESLTDSNNIDTTINELLGDLSEDVELIVIQLGDNVNTPEKNAIFPESSLKFCQAIRNKCSKARVVWMGMWYSSSEKYENIENACLNTGCHFINFKDLVGSDANSKIGNIQKASLNDRIITNVISVEENSPTNIAITFTVNDVSYKTPSFDVESYSQEETTVTYRSEYSIITSGGVASHPGDEGFRRIANKFLYEMNLTDEQEYYSKEDLELS